MMLGRKYKYITIWVVVIFLVSNIGIPLILHYCKMMQSLTTNICSMCDNEQTSSNDRHITKIKSECCKTVILADRNKAEFLQTQKEGFAKSYQYSIVKQIYSSSIVELNYLTKSVFIDFHLPPPFEDIPIYNSSLLI